MPAQVRIQGTVGRDDVGNVGAPSRPLSSELGKQPKRVDMDQVKLPDHAFQARAHRWRVREAAGWTYGEEVQVEALHIGRELIRT